MKIKVSEKHIGLRIALTAVAFVIAVVAFTFGVTSIGKKEPGYHSIEAKTDAEALTYNNAVLYRYWFDGKSNEIKGKIRALTGVYTPVLSAAYKQLDHQKTYTGQVSIGTINQNQGEVVSVTPQLYAILKDAYEKTLEQKGYNMFAGALYAEWESIQILDNPDEFDPLNNEYIRYRRHSIAAVVSDLSNFSLEFLNDTTCSVRFSTSDAYKAFCAENEITAYALDLNLLKDAYMLSMMGEALVSEDFRLGHLSTKEGLALNTSPRGSLSFDMHTLENGNDTVYATVDLDGVFSAATFTAYGMGSDYGYVLESEGRKLYRHLYFDVRTGQFSDVLMSSVVISHDMDIVEDAYQTIILNTMGTEQAVTDYAAALEKSGKLVSYTFQSSMN